MNMVKNTMLAAVTRGSQRPPNESPFGKLSKSFCISALYSALSLFWVI